MTNAASNRNSVSAAMLLVAFLMLVMTVLGVLMWGLTASANYFLLSCMTSAVVMLLSLVVVFRARRQIQSPKYMHHSDADEQDTTD